MHIICAGILGLIIFSGKVKMLQQAFLSSFLIQILNTSKILKIFKFDA